MGVTDSSAPPELHANLASAHLEAGEIASARQSLKRAYAAGVHARNPRIVALQRLVSDAEGDQKAEAMAAVEEGPR
jgi:hypothetical protein